MNLDKKLIKLQKVLDDLGLIIESDNNDLVFKEIDQNSIVHKYKLSNTEVDENIQKDWCNEFTTSFEYKPILVKTTIEVKSN